MAENSTLFANAEAELEQDRIDEFFSSVLGLIHPTPSQPKRNAKEQVELRRKIEEILHAKQNKDFYDDSHF